MSDSVRNLPYLGAYWRIIPSVKLSRCDWMWLLGITALAAALRFYRLDHHSLWLDELVSIRDASHAFGEIHKATLSDPPLYLYMVRMVLLAFGPNEYALKALSALFGVLAIPSIFIMSFNFWGRRAAIGGSLLAATSLFHLYYSQELRMYSLLPLTSLFTVYFWVRAVETDSAKSWVGYVVSVAAMLYTHSWGPFFMASQALCFGLEMLRQRRLSKAGFIAYAAIAVIYAPWVPHILHQASLDVYGSLIMPAWVAFRETWYAFSGVRIPVGDSWVGVGRDARLPLVWLAIGFLAAGLWWKGAGRERARRVFLAGLLVPLAVVFAITVFYRPIYAPGRYTIIAWPAFILTVSRLFEMVSGRALRTTVALAGIWMATSLHLHYVYTHHYTKARWKTMFAWLDQSLPSREPVLIDPQVLFAHWFAQYYMPDRPQRLGPLVKGEEKYAVLISPQTETDRRLRELPPGWTLRDRNTFADSDVLTFEQKT